MLFTAPQLEHESDVKITTIDTYLRCESDNRSEDMYKPSGVVVTYMCFLNKRRNTVWSWGKKHLSIICQRNQTWFGQVQLILVQKVYITHMVRTAIMADLITLLMNNM